MGYDDDDFLVGEEADGLFKEDTGHRAASKVALSSAKAGNANPYLEAITILEEGLRLGEVKDESLQELANLIPTTLFDIEPITQEFDMKQELAEQQALVTSMRMSIMNPGGKGLRKGVSVSESKSVLDACRNFSETIRKNLESFVNLGRIQALESAVLESISGESEEFKRTFKANLEKALAVHCRNNN